jgi:hypothetical protein
MYLKKAILLRSLLLIVSYTLVLHCFAQRAGGNTADSTPVRTSYADMLHGPYPQQEGSFAWVFDTDGEPVIHAEINYSGKNASGTIKYATGKGIYTFPTLAPGLYTLTVKAAGYETYKRVATVYAMGHFRSKIVLGRPGSIYGFTPWGPVPLINPAEIVGFTSKIAATNDPYELQAITEAVTTEIKRICYLLPPGNYCNVLSRKIAWPKDQAQRAAFQQAIEQSTIIQTHALYLSDDPSFNAPITSYADCRIAATISEEEVRKVLAAHHFNIVSLSIGNINNNDDQVLVAGITYQLPLSLDYLRHLDAINKILPVTDIFVSYIPGVEPTGRSLMPRVK